MSDIRCKRCDGTNIKYIKKWNVKSGRSKKEFEVKLHYCKDCYKSFREIKSI